MHIVHITSELAPFIKTGGLADVVHGLSKELIRQGHQVTVILPKYDCLDIKNIEELHPLPSPLAIKRPEGIIYNTLYTAKSDHIPVLLIEPHDATAFFRRGTIYGGKDEVDRFLYFCQAAKEAIQQLPQAPDVVHLHDWPTAFLAPLLRTSPFPTLLTIHNMQHQGICSKETLLNAGLPLFDELQQGDHYNPLKGGILLADHITTVSPQYRQEIEEPEGGAGLEAAIQIRSSHVTGILNGIDTGYWNPETDRYLPFHYSSQKLNASDLPQLLTGKEKNKKALCNTLKLPFKPNTPLVASIARLVPQKSPELLAYALRRTIAQGGQFVLLGSSPIPALTQEFRALQQEVLSDEKARVIMDTDEALAHQIYAAADLFVIPSLFEPCGLTQLIALRYGTIPLARKTGGLANTVFDKDATSIPPEKRNGFTFDFPDQTGLDWALTRALECYTQQRPQWEQLLLQGTHQDISWTPSTQRYLDVYRLLTTHSKSTLHVNAVRKEIFNS